MKAKTDHGDAIGSEEQGVPRKVPSSGEKSRGYKRVREWQTEVPVSQLFRTNRDARTYLKLHPDWARADYRELAPRLVELEIQAHPEAAGLPVSTIEIDSKGEVFWLSRGVCDTRQAD